MKLQIERLIVWPKKEGFDPREIEFKPNCVNVLSGDSRTGKSAVVAIIDYCLGSHDCSVPGGKVRENASWFGIVISTADGRHLLARRNPDAERKETSKISVVAKEASESEYWLLLLKELYPNVAEISPVLIEAGELVCIFDKIRVTMRSKSIQ